MAALYKVKRRRRTGSSTSLQILVLVLIIFVFSICFILFLMTYKGSPGDGSSLSAPSETTVAETSPPADTTAEAASAPVSSETGGTEAVTTAPPASVDTNSNPVPETADAGAEYFNDAAFVGDSLSVGLSLYGFIDSNHVLADRGMNIEKIHTATVKTDYGELTVLDTLTQLKPAKVYIMLGSNGIAWIDNPTMIGYYGTFIDEVKQTLENPVIYVLTIPPVTAKLETAKQPITNAAINSYNAELLKLANDKQVHLVDLHSVIAGQDGLLPAEFDAGDGMHFQSVAYETMLDFLRKHTAGV